MEKTGLYPKFDQKTSIYTYVVVQIELIHSLLRSNRELYSQGGKALHKILILTISKYFAYVQGES
jgi:hypothetical protein